MNGIFRMIFHGIIAIVADGDRFHVIVPDTRKGTLNKEGKYREELAADEAELARHAPQCSAYPKVKLNGQRIFIDGLPGGSATADTSLYALPRMRLVVGGRLSQLDRYYQRATGVRPPSSAGPSRPNRLPGVLACMTIDRGVLRSDLPTLKGSASLPALEGTDGTATEGLIATAAIWEVKLEPDEPIHLRLVTLAGGSEQRTKIEPLADDRSVREVLLTNGCEDKNHEHSDVGKTDKDDPDFRWYYRMLEERREIKRLVWASQKELPFPKTAGSIERIDALNIQGINCRVALFE
jgi:hypothetical protein